MTWETKVKIKINDGTPCTCPSFDKIASLTCRLGKTQCKQFHVGSYGFQLV